MNSPLLLPGEPGFWQLLHSTPPPTQRRDRDFVVRAGGVLLEEVCDTQLDEYLEGGEYEERMGEIEDDFEEPSLLYLPESIVLNR